MSNKQQTAVVTGVVFIAGAAILTAAAKQQGHIAGLPGWTVTAAGLGVSWLITQTGLIR